MNVCRVVQYIDMAARTAADRICAVARYCDISSKKQIVETFLSSTIKIRAPDRKGTLPSELKGAGARGACARH